MSTRFLRRLARGWIASGLALLAVCSSAATAPAWLQAAARSPVTVGTSGADAVILLEDKQIEIMRDARRATRMRVAVKILENEGRQRAVAVVPYLSSAGKVTNFKAWLVKPGGRVVELGRKEIIDAAVHDGAPELYSDARKQFLSAVAHAEVGAVFGYEAEVTTKTVFNQEQFVFQNNVPTEISRLAVKLAPGWDLRTLVRHASNLVAEVTGDTRIWTNRAVPAWPDEPLSVSPLRLAPTVLIDLLPPPNLAAERAGLRAVTWEDWARHFSSVYDAASQATPPLRSRAGQLTAGAASPWENVQRLAGFVQGLNYVSVTLDSASGGGMTPRPAERVLQAGYGDCKDKTTLLRALLAGVGVESYPLIVLSGSKGRIEAEWPSPTQFNHCVLAIRTDEPASSAAVIAHPELGRLLVFDPTDESTPLGELNDRLAAQGLLLSGASGGLVDLPAVVQAPSRLVRTVEAELDAFGSVRASIVEQFSGVAAAIARREFREGSTADYRRIVERWLGASLPALRDVTIEPVDRFEAGEFELTTCFASFGYGKLMRNELLVLKPVLVARRHVSRLGRGPRALPVLLRANSYEERTTFALPREFVVDELPRGVTLDTAFGHYRAECKVVEGRVISERVLTVRAMELPVSDYEEVRAFYEKIHEVEQSPMVLRRVPAAEGRATPGAAGTRP